MNYTTLVAAKTTAGSIKRQTNYGQIDADVVLEEAQTLLFSMLRVREMRSLWSPSLSVGDSSKALPTGFQDPIEGDFMDTTGLLYKRKLETVVKTARTYTSGVLNSGQPSIWAIWDEAVQFDLKFDTAATLQLLYYKSPTLLSVSNETNWVTTRYPHLLRQATNVRAHAFMKAWDSYNTELPILVGMVERVNAESDLSYTGADYDARPSLNG